MNKEELREFSQKYADSQGFKLNPDKKALNTILEGLLKNEKQYSLRYCPCKLRLKENICPCKNSKKEIEETGHCKCTLFWKK